MKLYEGRRLCIATKHQKERVIAPVLEAHLGVKCEVVEGLDTDLLGTFSGEIKRTLNPLEAAKEKCRRAQAFTSCDLILASEGSFGPHPSFFFTPADDELMVLWDVKEAYFVACRHLTMDTNFGGIECNNLNQLMDFARTAGFPEHGLILKSETEQGEVCTKDFENGEQLAKHFERYIQAYGNCHVETDMRAMRNPTRMKAIEALSYKLLETLRNACPNCQAPGFDVHESKPGLPCSLCHQPTENTLIHTYSCNKCNFTEERWYPHDIKSADPMYCQHCNP